MAPDGDAWLHEIKLDGYRMHARLVDSDIRILTRRGNDWTTGPTIPDDRRREPQLLDDAKALPRGRKSLNRRISNALRTSAFARAVLAGALVTRTWLFSNRAGRRICGCTAWRW